MKKTKRNIFIFPLIIAGVMVFFVQDILGQNEYYVHSRGMLHQTVYNNGMLARAFQPRRGEETALPLLEWPPRGATVVEGKEYSGQHNSVGGGIFIAANPADAPGVENRLWALCGGAGAGRNTYLPGGRWSFPVEFRKRENFPILKDGTVNPNYNPDEAEEIIIAKWATSTGITVTRESRAWSYPDYDDFIIYEYTFENTGNLDQNPFTIEAERELRDVLIEFMHGAAPSMYGLQRHYNQWKHKEGAWRGDARGYHDWDYWLTFDMNVETNGDPDLAYKPEPDPDLFYRYAETGEMGGGLLSPQAPGLAVLYYDTTHLAIVDPTDGSTINESETVNYPDDALHQVVDTLTGIPDFITISNSNKIKQPWALNAGGGWNNPDGLQGGWDPRLEISTRSKGSVVYTNDPLSFLDISALNIDPNDFLGRGARNKNASWHAYENGFVFGPYTLKPGDKIEFTVAEVIGYGGEPGKMVIGGSDWETTYTQPIPEIDVRAVSARTGEVYTENYITDYGYPDFVNSDVINVQQVTHKAFQAYLGLANTEDLTVPVWPENNPKDGLYTIPATAPAPMITVNNLEDGTVSVSWDNAPETFTHPRLDGDLDNYRVYRSDSGIGWDLIQTIPAGHTTYEFIDTDNNYKVGETKYYAVTSVTTTGIESGMTNISKHGKDVAAVEKLGDVYVVPNPFVIESGFGGGSQLFKDQIGFYGLPEKCTIRIFSFSGQLVQTIEHDGNRYSEAWFQITRSEQDIASGIYFYTVTSITGEQTTGKFLVIK